MFENIGIKIIVIVLTIKKASNASIIKDPLNLYFDKSQTPLFNMED